MYFLFCLYSLFVITSSSSAENFNGYQWGTDFSTINQNENLEWFYDTDDRQVYLDNNLYEPGVKYTYVFHDNKLVQGIASFRKVDAYFKTLNPLEQQYGKATQTEKDRFWTSKNTIISSRLSGMPHIVYSSKKYLTEQMEKRLFEKVVF